MEDVLKELTLDFFGSGKHKVAPDTFFGKENGLFLDVRSREESESLTIGLKHYPHIVSLNIPVNEIPDRFQEIPKNKSIAVFCSGSVRSAIVYTFLLSKGFTDVRIMEGGYAVLTEALKPGQILKSMQQNP